MTGSRDPRLGWSGSHAAPLAELAGALAGAESLDELSNRALRAVRSSLSFMREFMSDVEIRETATGTQVTLRRRLSAPLAAPNTGAS